ncbi:MAG: T9SS type A sorting domain-containing protein [Bacteroidia bacterium]
MKNGINTSGIGIGRDIVAIIDKGTPNEKRYILNSFYKAKLNSYTTGDISYQLEFLEDGMHTYTLKVWDVYNNSSEATIEFVIKNNEEFAIEHVLNYPNPFSTNTSFHFDHNKAGENLDVVVTIMTISGKVLKTIEQRISNANSHVGDLFWNGRDDYDDKPSRGVYIYKISVRTEDGKKAEKVEKLVILN